MTFRCPHCERNVYSWSRILITTAFSPARCPVCSGLAGPSWWNVVVGLPFLLALVCGMYLSLLWASWVPIALAFPTFTFGTYAEFRFIPLVAISRREVQAHRIFLATFVAGLLSFMAYYIAVKYVGL